MGEKSEAVFRILRYVTQFLCLVGFSWLVYGTSRTYLNHAEMTVRTTKMESQLPLPMFWICYEWPFNDLYEAELDPENADMSDPKVYSKITKDPTEVSLTVVIETMTRETNYSTMSEHYEPNYYVTTLNTIWHGRCLKVEIQSNLSSNQFLALSLWNLTEKMVFHMGHPGDEILGLYGQGAYRNPKSTRISPERKYTEVDLQIRASKQEWGLLTTKKDCYVEHMRKLFENACTTPWTEYFTTQAKNCTESGKQYADGVNGTSDSNVFFERRLESNWLLNSPDSPCKGLTNDIEFGWELTDYLHHPHMSKKHQTRVQRKHKGFHILRFNYLSFEIEVDTVVRQVDIYQFVSFFGGGLGLFLGFAVYGTLLRFYKFGMKRLAKNKTTNSVEME